jgi:DnaJ-class molecular chaperone
MITKRTYLSGCTWCNATGFVKIPNPGFMTSALTGICPVCNGAMVVIVTETIEDNCNYNGLPDPIDVNPYDSKARKRKVK